MGLRFTENKARSSGLSITTNRTTSIFITATPRTAFSAHGLVEATQAEAEGITITGRYMSPLRTGQAMTAFLGGAGVVTSFETRTGAVVSVAGDYTASEITNVPAGNIAAVTVQAAIAELDSEKAASSEDFLVKTASAGLSAERVVTDTTSVTWDWATAGQAKATRAALTGDVTASADSNATTIANDAVTNAKLANMASHTVKGRLTAASGDPEDLAATDTTSISFDWGVAGQLRLYRAALTGDVTASLDSNATTIANDAVTFAKMQNIATDRLIGRDTAASGDPEEISLGTGLEFSGAAAIQTIRASTTEVLTGTDTAKAVTADALAALWEKGAAEASAATVAFGEGGYFHITGTTSITDIDWDTAKDGRMAWVVFDGALTLTHNATTLVLPGGANITTAANDRALFVQDATDNVYCLSYVKADGTAVVGGGGGFTAASQAEQEAGSLTTVGTTPGRQHFHPSAAKAWVKFNSAGTVAASYNITSITDTGVGNWTVNIATDFSSADYCGLPGGGDALGDATFYHTNAVAAGTFQVSCHRYSDGGVVDPDQPDAIFGVFFGDHV